MLFNLALVKQRIKNIWKFGLNQLEDYSSLIELKVSTHCVPRNFNFIISISIVFIGEKFQMFVSGA